MMKFVILSCIVLAIVAITLLWPYIMALTSHTFSERLTMGTAIVCVGSLILMGLTLYFAIKVLKNPFYFD